MKGVEILSTSQVVAETTFSCMAVIIAVVLTMAVFITLGIYLSIEENDFSYAIFFIIIGVIFSVLTGGITGGITETPTAYETQYKVTIDDSVSMIEFNEKFEVLDQDGKIYLVRERTAGEE